MKILQFKAAWCAPCRLQEKILKRFTELHPEIKVEQSDVDQNPDLAQSYNVMSIPTLVVFDDNDEVIGSSHGQGVLSVEGVEDLCGC